MENAFVLGAGLGTRLRPLTEDIPKPLVPVGNRPLITYAFDHVIGAGAKRIIVNTHHRPECYDATFPDATYRGIPLVFKHEPVLLETGGGIANIVPDVAAGDSVGDGLLVYNGDILARFDLAPALEQHRRTGAAATLVLRPSGPSLHIALDAATSRVLDIRNKLGTGLEHSFQFSGIYFLSDEFLSRMPPVAKYSVIPVFLDAIRRGELHGAVVQDGYWADLGNREEYLDAQGEIYRADHGWAPCAAISPDAEIDPTAAVKGSTVGEGAAVGPGAVVRDSVLWPGGRVAAGANLVRCVVRTGKIADGVLSDADV